MSKQLDKKKFLKNIALIFLVSILVLAYPVYAIVVWCTSGSPDDISKFPTQGVWICEENNFVITIDLRDLNEYDNPVDNMKVTLQFNEGEQTLFCYQTGGHGTPLAPVKPSHILSFESKDVGKFEENYIQFNTHKYKFNENDSYLLDISLTRYNKVDIFKENMNLHFIKSDT